MNFDDILTLIKLHPAISFASLPILGGILWHFVLTNWRKLLPIVLKMCLRWMKREELLKYVQVVDDIADEAIKDLQPPLITEADTAHFIDKTIPPAEQKPEAK